MKKHLITLDSKKYKIRTDSPMTHQQGASLIEVLVAIIVLSFGLLGMVGMQLMALQVNRDARLQSTAVALAGELAEMMRGNKSVALQAAAGNPYLGDFESPLEPKTASYCLSVNSSCATATDVASSEMTEWLARVDDALPQARVEICKDAAPYDSDGLPQWDCTSTSSAPAVIKIGWSRMTTKIDSGVSAQRLDRATRPSVVVPVTAGSAG